MGKGLAQAILISSLEAFKNASPMKKITPQGYLQYLLANTKPNVLSNGIDDGSGYIRNVKLRYMQRGVPGKSVTVDDCSIQTTAAYIDKDLPVTHFRALGISFEDDIIARFEKDALASINPGGAPTAIMNEIWEVIISKANGLFTDINNDLLTDQSVNFGKNISTGLNTAKTVNFALNGTNNNLSSGMTQVLADAMINESTLLNSSIVGSGIILNYSLQQQAKSADQAGVNTARLQLPDFKFDPYANPIWAADNFGLFEKDAVQLLNVCRFRGAKAGMKGSDYFFTVKLPVYDSIGQGTVRDFEFDVQLTYRTCASDIMIGAVSTHVGRGWNVILMSSYNQVNIPADSYAVGDRMVGNNGTYLYKATNV